jgi:hypothetical protein
MLTNLTHESKPALMLAVQALSRSVVSSVDARCNLLFSAYYLALSSDLAI